MATRAAIIDTNDSNPIGVYSHWDGYRSGLGVKLMKHFNSDEKVKKLVKGDIAEIDDDGKVRYFPEPRFKEEGVSHAPIGGATLNNWQDVADMIAHNDHIYVWWLGEWHYAQSTKDGLMTLKAALERDEKEMAYSAQDSGAGGWKLPE